MYKLLRDGWKKETHIMILKPFSPQKVNTILTFSINIFFSIPN